LKTVQSKGLVGWAKGVGLVGMLAVLTMTAGCITNIIQATTDTFATKVNFLIPAKNAEVASLKSVLLVTDNQVVSQQVAQGFEASMSALRIQERPYYSNLKSGPHFNGEPSDAQLVALAKNNGVEAVYMFSGGATSNKSLRRTEDRSTCAVQVKLFEPCPQNQQRNSKVGCVTEQGFAAVRLRVLRAADGKSVYTNTLQGSIEGNYCDDQQTARMDAGQLAYGATQNATALGMRIVAPGYELRPLEMMDADAGVPAEKVKEFQAAVNFAEAKRLDEACKRFEELYLDHKESKALTFNIAFCQEARGNLLRANQGYRRASELVNAPDAKIDRRLAATELALRESPAVFMPVNDTPSLVAEGHAAVGNGPKVALVVGNARYQRSALINPVQDARLVANRLTRIGFDVTLLENLDAARFNAATRDFSVRAKGADVALFYYAGHALQADGENFLMPVDNANMRTMEDVRDGGGVQLAMVLAQLEVAAPAVKLIVIDACRDNPLPSANRSLAGGGLAAIRKPPQGGLIAFATSPGKVAEDGTGKNSVFSKYFAQQVGVPNQTVEQLFKRVRQAVKAETKDRQEPTEVSSLTADVMLVTAKP